MTLAAIAAEAGAEGLSVLGAFHPHEDDAAPGGCATLALLGPSEPAFWARFRASGEMRDGRHDPLDRWSRRVIGALAARFGGSAVFPFGGPPHRPFTAWARRSGRAWDSPVGLLVHDEAGLFVSFRGALALPERLELGRGRTRPCDGCGAPCLTACPVGALGGAGYDVAACHAWLEGDAGRACATRGCAVRRACPVGAGLRPEAQSAFHMAAFHASDRG
jgi:epoxyqueuosine reductase